MIENFKSANATLTAKASLIWKSRAFGSFFAFLLMGFNAATTISGAGKVLPPEIGIPIGCLISLTYFFIVVNRRIKREHPLRRFLLVLLFSIFSTYSSLFSIYEAVNNGHLKDKSVEKILDSHNQFIESYKSTVIAAKNEINSSDPRLQNYQKISKDIGQLEAKIVAKGQEIQRLEGSGGTPESIKNLRDRMGPFIGRKDSLDRERKILEEDLKEVPNYLKYQKILEIEEKISDLLKTEPPQKNFIPADLYRNDYSLYDFLKTSLVASEVKDEKFIQEKFKAPSKSNYKEVPIFVLPIEIIIDGGNESISIIFCAAMAISMELIPLLLGGIRTGSQDGLVDKGSNLKDINDFSSNINPIKNNSNKTTLGQVSEGLSSSMINFKKLFKEVWRSMRYGVGTTESVKNKLYYQLDLVLISMNFTSDSERRGFLAWFYLAIDHNLKEISLDSFLHKSETNGIQANVQSFMAASMLIDLMKNHDIGWLKESTHFSIINAGKLFPFKSKKYESKNGPELSNLSNVQPPTNSIDYSMTNFSGLPCLDDEIHPDLNLNKKQRIYFRYLQSSTDKKDAPAKLCKWKFTERSYQEFLDWWLNAQNLQEIYYDDIFMTTLKITLPYYMKIKFF